VFPKCDREPDVGSRNDVERRWWRSCCLMSLASGDKPCEAKQESLDMSAELKT
jgi:hypothetical protein